MKFQSLSALGLIMAPLVWSACGGPSHPPLPATVAGFDSLDPRVAALLEESHADLAQAPADPEVWRRLGLAREAHGLYAEAAEVYSAALELAPRDAQLWYRLASALELADERAAAREALEQVLTLEGGYAPAHWRMGYFALQDAELDVARAHFGQALRVDPASEPATLGLIELELAAGEAGRAVEVLRGAPVLEGRNGPHALRLLGMALKRSGQDEEAEALLATYRKAKPSFLDPWSEEVHEYERGMATINRRARTLIAEGRGLEATRMLEAAREQESANGVILRTLGAAYSAVGRTRDARDVLREASQLDPANLELRVDAAWASAMYGDLEEALAEGQAVLEVDPTFHKASTLRTRILIDRGLQAEAVAQFAVALEHGAQEPAVAVDAGKTLIELGRLDEAAEMFELVTSQDPGRLPGWIGLALVALEQGDLDRARRAIQRARALHGLRADAGDGPILDVIEARLAELEQGAR